MTNYYFQIKSIKTGVCLVVVPQSHWDSNHSFTTQHPLYDPTSHSKGIFASTLKDKQGLSLLTPCHFLANDVDYDDLIDTLDQLSDDLDINFDETDDLLCG